MENIKENKGVRNHGLEFLYSKRLDFHHSLTIFAIVSLSPTRPENEPKKLLEQLVLKPLLNNNCVLDILIFHCLV